MKRKGQIAVFENVEVNGKKIKRDEDVDDPPAAPGPSNSSKNRFKITNAPQSILCQYPGCSILCKNIYEYDSHLLEHVKSSFADLPDDLTCKYPNCEFQAVNRDHMIQHVTDHGYYQGLMDLGTYVAKEKALPDCLLDFGLKFSEEPASYICRWDDCGVITETRQQYFVHVQMHVHGYPKRDANIPCGWKGCTIYMRELCEFTKHIRSHTKRSLLACPTCGGTFASVERYCDHRKKQIPIEKHNYKCSQCSKLFATESILRNHVRAHVNQYKCSMCDMTCPKPSLLATHIRFRHLESRPFKCHLCSHSSISQQNLEIHLITHCAEKLFACDECDFQCRSMYGLDKHLHKVHGQNTVQTFECHLCQAQYNRGQHLTKHLRQEHEIQWPSGHSRFRYKEDPDGIHRLQTIRYETVEVIKEIIKSNTEGAEPPLPKKVKCIVGTDNIVIETVEEEEDEKNQLKQEKSVDS